MHSVTENCIVVQLSFFKNVLTFNTMDFALIILLKYLNKINIYS